jgi:hypothetical protein
MRAGLEVNVMLATDDLLIVMMMMMMMRMMMIESVKNREII